MLLGLGNVNTTQATTPQPINALAMANTLPYPPPVNIFQFSLIARRGNVGAIFIYIKDYKTGLYSQATADGLVASQACNFQGTSSQPLLDFTVFNLYTTNSGDGFAGWILF